MKKLFWIQGLLATILLAVLQVAYAGETVTYYHTDALGSVVATSDANGNVIERREYEPYGAQLMPAVSDGPGYTGHVSDAATGLVYMQQRYYDPGIGRMLSVDPVSADANTGANFGRYVYANNNPYRFYDPDGRKPEDNTTPPPQDCGSQPCPSRRERKEQRDRERNSDMVIARATSYSGPGAVFTSQDTARDAANAYITESNGGPILSALFGQSYLTNVTQIDSSPDLFTYSFTPIITGMSPSAMIRGAPAGLITGYTRHGLHQAISRDGGRGVAAMSILNAVRRPISVAAGRGSTVKYIGADGTTVVLNQAGKVITTYGVPRAP